MRATPGQLVETFDGNGGIDRWEVLEVSNKEIKLAHVQHDEIPRRSPVYLVLGLNPLKGGNEEITIRMAAAMEVSEIVPVFFRRSEVPIDFDRLERRLERWHRFCVAETITSGGAYLPKIGRPATLASFLDGRETGVIFDEEAKPGKNDDISFKKGSYVAALIGPEGGLERDEVNLAIDNGFWPASFGAWTLRAELAGALVPAWIYSRVIF